MSHENLSAMLDGECSDEEVAMLLEAIESSTELTEKWSRLCLAHDLVSGNSTPASVPKNFCAGVMAAIDEAEPVSNVVAFPVSAQPQVGREINKPSRRQSRFRRDVARPLVGLAAAASLAFVAVAAGRSFFGHLEQGQPTADTAALHQDGSQQLAAVSSTNAARGGLVQVSNRGSSEEMADTGIAQLDPDSARELNAYFAQHNNFGADQGLGGPLGAGRMAVRTVEYRTAADGSR